MVATDVIAAGGGISSSRTTEALLGAPRLITQVLSHLKWPFTDIVLHLHHTESPAQLVQFMDNLPS